MFRSNRFTALVAIIACTALLLAGCGSSSSAKLVSIGAGLSGPKELRATVYATGLKNAAAFAFDTEGRLWVATADYSDTGQGRACIVVAKRGATPVKVISGLHTPLGLLWYRGALYVGSTGRVDAFSDLHGTTFATRRQVLKLPAKVGESNNIVVTSDGRMLMGISAPCDHCTPKSKYSAAIISFRPDGTDLRVFASGIRAPVGLAYYPGTTDLFVTMNQRDDLGTSTPGDWLAVVKDGDDWKFPACYGQGDNRVHRRAATGRGARHARGRGRRRDRDRPSSARASGPRHSSRSGRRATVLRVALEKSGSDLRQQGDDAARRRREPGRR